MAPVQHSSERYENGVSPSGTGKPGKRYCSNSRSTEHDVATLVFQDRDGRIADRWLHGDDRPAIAVELTRAVGAMVISGYADGTFRPGNPATRGQIGKLVYSAITQP